MHINLFIFFCSIYLFVVFWGTWREIFMNGFVYFLNKPPCGRLYGPFGTGRGLRPRSLKQPLDKNIIWTMHINIFIFFCSIYFIRCFLRDMERNLFKRVLSKNILWTMHMKLFFNFSNLFVPYILCLFFEGHGEKSFWMDLYIHINIIF